jgi:hypothetical protein
MTMLYQDQLFASLDVDLHLERIAGGNETEVYCSDDRQYVVKVKSDDGGAADLALARAVSRRDAARAFAQVMGPNHSIPTYFILGRNSAGEVQAVAIQPYLREATPLFAIDYRTLDLAERQWIAGQLLAILGRSVRTLLTRGWMPDLYGRSNASSEERRRARTWRNLPARLWSFLVQRTLLRSHNLLLTPEPHHTLVLVDYDPVPRSRLYRLVYYSMRLWLFVRDVALILFLWAGGSVPAA